MTRVILGTNNQKKKAEMLQLLSPYGIHLKILSDFSNALEVEETGLTFQENAQLKASIQARHLHEWVIGEDSGLEVEALSWRPGVFSARYAGEPRSDERNNALLLEELKNVPLHQRTARYVCHAALSDPNGNILADVEEYCYGRILYQLTGTNGFGYDPLFEIVEYHRTFGVLSPEVKGCISHRARALRKLTPLLVKYLR